MGLYIYHVIAIYRHDVAFSTYGPSGVHLQCDLESIWYALAIHSDFTVM